MPDNDTAAERRIRRVAAALYIADTQAVPDTADSLDAFAREIDSKGDADTWCRCRILATVLLATDDTNP